VRGKWYRPREQPGYDKIGKASWYGPNFHGRLTANGEIYDQYSLSGAHPTFPLPSYARVTNLANGNSVVVRVNDRGPYAHGRVIDMSAKAAELLDYKRKGIAKVRVEYLGKARLDGRDQRFLVASFKPGRGYRGGASSSVPGVMLASNRPPASVGSIPVTSFVSAPFPKERPVFTGGIPVEVQANRGLMAPDIPQPPTSAATIERQKLEPMNPALVQKVKDGFIISSYAAGQRISNAHLVAQRIIRPGSGLYESKVRRHWKRTNH
jgi:rare lipoprotein A